MAAQRNSLKRKPLSDCTNTISARTNAVRRKPTLRSALKQPESCSVINDEAPVGSLKSNTSTGSNNPPLSTSARSSLLTVSHVSENEGKKKRKEGKPLAEHVCVQLGLEGIEKEETKKRKVKGKAPAVDTILRGRENEETPRNKGKVVAEDSAAKIAIDDRENEEEKRRKEKGKAIVEDTGGRFALHGRESEEAKRKKDKGKAIVEDTAAQFALHGRENEEAQRRKDKGIVIREDTAAQFALHGRENEEAVRRKDKGKATLEDTAAQFALHGRENEEAIRRKEKGKAVVEDSVAPTALYGTENEETKRRKEKGKALVEDIVALFALDGSENEEAWRRDKDNAPVEDIFVQFNPVSSTSMELSSPTVPDPSRCRTIYTRKRVPEARNLRSLKITEPFSCPPLQRLKDKGKQIDVGGGDEKSGMRRHSLSAPKKQSRTKSKPKSAADTMPKEEVEKLKAYYADIDAFELPVEEANDSD